MCVGILGVFYVVVGVVGCLCKMCCCCRMCKCLFVLGGGVVVGCGCVLVF